MPDINKASESPKTTSTGTVKNPATGSTKAASEREGVITGDRKGEDPKTESQIANTPTAKTLAEEKREAENQESDEQLPKGFSEISGEVLQGDSFRITIKRGNTTMFIPVPVTGTSNVIVLDNTFRIIKAIQEAKNPKELQDKFASFVQ